MNSAERLRTHDNNGIVRTLCLGVLARHLTELEIFQVPLTAILPFAYRCGQFVKLVGQLVDLMSQNIVYPFAETRWLPEAKNRSGRFCVDVG